MSRQPSMQRRHFELIARTLRETNAHPGQVRSFADALRGTNPGFDYGRFVTAASRIESQAQLDHEEDAAIERNAHKLAEAVG